MVLNRYEYTKINNNRLPDSWKTQSSLDDLAEFLQENWEQRSVFYEDGEITSSQQFLEFTGQQGIKTKKYIGTSVFKGEQLNIYPKVFSTEKDDHERNSNAEGWKQEISAGKTGNRRYISGYSRRHLPERTAPIRADRHMLRCQSDPGGHFPGRNRRSFHYKSRRQRN